MLRQYDLKRVVIASGETETPAFANSPGASGALVYLPVGWTGGAALTYLAARKDWRVRHLSETTGTGETSVPQLQIPEAPIADVDGVAIGNTGAIADQWHEMPEQALMAPGIRIKFAATSREETIYVWQKA
jgi:hypothetical protein